MKFLNKFWSRTNAKRIAVTGRNLDSLALKERQVEARKLFDAEPEQAIAVAMGTQTVADEVMAAAIYAVVCNAKEKDADVVACAQIANSSDNSKLSANARLMKFRDADSPIEVMKNVVNARREAVEKTLPKGTTIEDAVEKEVAGLGAFLDFLTGYVEYLVKSEPKIKIEIASLKDRTRQNVVEGPFIQEMWVLRYTLAHIWFLNLDSPKHQSALEVNVQLVRKAFQNVLAKNAKSDYLPWLATGFIEYAGNSDFAIRDLKKLQPRFEAKLLEKIPRIAFDATEGRRRL